MFSDDLEIDKQTASILVERGVDLIEVLTIISDCVEFLKAHVSVDGYISKEVLNIKIELEAGVEATKAADICERVYRRDK